MKIITLLLSALLFSSYINAQCNEPTNVRIVNEWYDIFIQWDDNGENLWDIEFGEAGFSPTGIPSIEDLSDSFIVIGYNSPFESEIYIDFYVRADCGPEQSDWVGPLMFFNYCTALVEQSFCEGISEDFDNGFPPFCWTEANQGTPDTGMSGLGNSDWESGSFANAATSTGAKVNINGNQVNEWLVLPAMIGGMLVKDILYEHLLLTFDIALTQHNTTDVANLGSDDQVQLVLSTDLGETWTNLRTWDSNSTISNTGEYVYIEYENWELFEKIFLVAFWAGSGTVSDTENVDFFIDNIFALSPVTGKVDDLSSKGFSYFPNPTKNIVNLSAEEIIDHAILYNSLGQEVKRVVIDNLSHQLDISELPEAVYYMHVRIGDTVGVVPVVKN